MTAKRLAQFAVAARTAGGALVVDAILSACAAAPNGAAPVDAAGYGPGYGFSVAAELRVARTQQEVASCLRQRENSMSYPLGVGPGYTAIESDHGAIRVTQWFFLERGMTRTTRFVLLPADGSATDVQVWLPMEMTVARDYRRAAVELIARCQADPVGAH